MMLFAGLIVGVPGWATPVSSAPASWSQQAELTPSDGRITSGWSVAVQGSTAVMGAPGPIEGSQAGAAYVFARSNGIWSQQAELTIGADDDQFGVSVAVSGSIVVVGADWNANNYAGAAFVYVYANGVWSQEAELTASDGAVNDGFGASVALSGSRLIVGAPGHDGVGAGYVFARSNGVWSQQAELTPSDGTTFDSFGASVALSGSTAVVGAPLKGSDDAGEAYAFVRSNGIWSQQAELTASDPAPNDFFGHSVAVSGATAIVGAPAGGSHEASPGTVYAFTAAGGAWSQQAELTAPDSVADDEFGNSVALDGSTALVGAPFAAPTHDGGAYVFTGPGGVWSQRAKFTSSPRAKGADFGFSVALYRSTAVAGAPYCCPPIMGSGAAFVFVNSGASAWPTLLGEINGNRIGAIRPSTALPSNRKPPDSAPRQTP
jgi:hypothetical protein